MARIIAFSNCKGGTGKTTTTVNVSAALAHRGTRVLVVDSDPQGHATLSLGIQASRVKKDLYSFLLADEGPLDAILETYLNRLKIIPATKKLAIFEKRYSGIKEARTYLSERLAGVAKMFDYIIIDTPPTLSLLTFSALIACDEVIIPVQAHFLGMKGLLDMVRLLYKIRQLYKPELELKGIIPTFFNEKTRLSKAIITEIKKNFGENAILHPVRTNISPAEAPMFGKSIFQYNQKSTGAIDYLRIADQPANKKRTVEDRASLQEGSSVPAQATNQ